MKTTIESLYDYSTTQFEAVDHILGMGAGAHYAALFLFFVMARMVAPKYRVATALSAFVMISSGLILFSLSGLWKLAFEYKDGVYQAADVTFSNGYRYVNWMITLPALLVQLLIVLNIPRSILIKKAALLILLAWGMVITGYIGQTMEVTDTDGMMLWGAISAVFFAALLYIIGMAIARYRHTMLDGTGSIILKVFLLMILAWTLYPIAYAIPVIDASPAGVVWRQGLFTVADISSKVVYGMMLCYIALKQSAASGYIRAQKLLDQIPQGGSSN